MSQSSNDVIPTAIHLSAALELTEHLLRRSSTSATSSSPKAAALREVVKTGRTHLMDAMPVRFDQELGGWATQIRTDYYRVASVLPRLSAVAQGGTAVGTGINAHPEFGVRFSAALATRTGIGFRPADSYFEALSSQDTAVELSGQLKTTAVSLMKIANDSALDEQRSHWPGSARSRCRHCNRAAASCPGKVNPVIPEACAMVAAQVIGNDAAITTAGQSGNFQLNVMLPLVAHNLLQSIELLANASRALADTAIEGFSVNEDRLSGALERNPILVTALNPIIGYEKGAAIAKQAYAEGRSVREVAAEQTDLDDEQLDRLLDPAGLTRGGIKSNAESQSESQAPAEGEQGFQACLPADRSAHAAEGDTAPHHHRYHQPDHGEAA